MSMGLRFDFDEVLDANRRFAILQKLVPSIELADAVGAEVEDQVRARIGDEKESPDGQPWEPWSAAYAKTRQSNHSLLQNEGDLLDDITYEAFTDHVLVGSNLVYFGVMNFGNEAQNIPARPVLGFSDENVNDLQDVVSVFLNQQIGALT